MGIAQPVAPSEETVTILFIDFQVGSLYLPLKRFIHKR